MKHWHVPAIGRRDLITKDKTSSQDGLSQTRAVFLVGFMGAGKTTIGRELSSRLKCRFVDLDDIVVEAAGRAVADIFRDEGEKGFRSRESAALQTVLQSLVPNQPTVIALGGGAFVQPENYEVIRRVQIPTVFLDARVDTLLKRCHGEGKERPLAQDENLFRQLYEARRSGYMRAEHRVQTTGKTVAGIVAEIISRLGWSNDFQEVPKNR